MKYPTLKEVKSADRFTICGWYRFLPLPENNKQVKIINRICERLKDLRGFTPEISKKLGLVKKEA